MVVSMVSDSVIYCSLFCLFFFPFSLFQRRGMYGRVGIFCF